MRALCASILEGSVIGARRWRIIIRWYTTYSLRQPDVSGN